MGAWAAETLRDAYSPTPPPPRNIAICVHLDAGRIKVRVKVISRLSHTPLTLTQNFCAIACGSGAERAVFGGSADLCHIDRLSEEFRPSNRALTRVTYVCWYRAADKARKVIAVRWVIVLINDRGESRSRDRTDWLGLTVACSNTYVQPAGG